MKSSRPLLLVAVPALLIAGCGHSGGKQAVPPATRAAPLRGATVSAPRPAAAGAPQTAPGAGVAQAAPFDPASFRLQLERVANGFAEPTFVTNAGDGSGRLFVVERAGRIRIIANGQTLPDPFLDIRSLVGKGGPEQGLLGLAFHPQFAQNGRFYVMYTANNSSTGDNTVAEYRLSADPNRGDPATARILLAIPDFAINHNGGMLAFGPDGYLYIGTGDGGGGGDPKHNSQNLGALLAKLLRLAVDGGQPYGIPPDNPFAGRQGARPEIWAYGLRNPWRFSFDRATGDLYIGDVGQNLWEEIDVQSAASHGGENYGWNILEGTHCYQPSSGCDPTGTTLPVLDYGHDLGCAVIGGYVYRGAASPALFGAYFYADECSGRIWALYPAADGSWQHAELLKANTQISSFGEDEAGEVYLVGYNTGTIFRLTAAPR